MQQLTRHAGLRSSPAYYGFGSAAFPDTCYRREVASPLQVVLLATPRAALRRCRDASLGTATHQAPLGIARA